MASNEPTRTRTKHSPQAEREVRRDTPLRQARTCYGHLAGVAGVELMEELLRHQWVAESASPVSGNRVAYGLTSKGRKAMAGLGVDLAAAGKTTGEFAFGCLDWTEPGHHLGGSLGRAVTACLSKRGLVGRTDGTREVVLKGNPASWFR